MTATLKLTRGWLGVQRHPFEITLDGVAAGTLAREQTVELPVQPGRHTVRLRSGRLTSPERSFDVIDGQVIAFTGHGATIWPIYLAALVKPDLGITLKRD